MVPRQAAQHIRDGAAAMGKDEVHVGVFQEMPGKKHARHRCCGIRAPAHGVDHVVVQKTGIAAAEHGMQIYGGCQVVSGFPKWIQVRVVQVTFVAFRLGANHRTLEAAG